MDRLLKNTDESAFIFPFIPRKEGFGRGEQFVKGNAGSGCRYAHWGSAYEQIDGVGMIGFNGDIEEEIVFGVRQYPDAEITDKRTRLTD